MKEYKRFRVTLAYEVYASNEEDAKEEVWMVMNSWDSSGTIHESCTSVESIDG